MLFGHLKDIDEKIFINLLKITVHFLLESK